MVYERTKTVIAAVAIMALVAALFLPMRAPAECDGCTGQVFDYISQGEHNSYHCEPDPCLGEKWYEEAHYKDQYFPGGEPGCKVVVDTGYWVFDCRWCPIHKMWRRVVEIEEIELCCTCPSP